MALAILIPVDGSGDSGHRWFRFDIGANRYWRYAVGGPDRRRLDGISLIDRPSHVSVVFGPLPDSAMGRGRFGIDEALFSRDAEFVQMMSYRTADRCGPAVSGIVRSMPPLPALVPPPPGLSRVRAAAQAQAPLVRAFSFWDIITAALPAIGQLLGGIGASGATAPAAGAPVSGGGLLARLADPATVRLLAQLVQQATAAAPPAAVGQAAPPSVAQTAFAQGVPARPRVSEAQVLPALLAALPALMPLLQQVLNPQTIQTLINAPTQGAQTIINGLNDVLRIGVAADQAHLDHLRALNPGVDDPALDRLIEGLGVTLSGRRVRPAFHRTSRVRLAFDGLRSVSVAGENRILFAHDREIVLPMRVELPRLRSGKAPTLRDAELALLVKDPTTLAIRRRAAVKIPAVTASGPVGAVTLPADAVAGLGAGRDWLLSVSLSWRAPKNSGVKRLGAIMTTLVHVAGPLVYDGLIDSGQAVDLADPKMHRALWHKLWAGRFEAGAKRFDTEIDYAYGWDAGATAASRDDSRIRTRPAEGSVATVAARVKAGLTLTTEALAAVAASLEPGTPPLTSEERQALTDQAVAARLGLGARLRLMLRGRENEAFAVWAYPAVRRATLRLAAPAEILETGNIITLAVHERPFAVPVAINIIGTRAR